MRRAFAGIAGLAIASLTVTGCSSGSTTSEASSPAAAGASESAAATQAAGGSGGLEIWANEEVFANVKKQAEQFAADNGITVAVKSYQKAKLRDAARKGILADQGPDLFIAAHDWIGELVTNGVIAPIDLGDKVDKFQKIAVTAFNYDGKNYGVPFAVENIALFRNTELAPESPKTIEDMAATGLALKKAKKATVPIGLQITESGDPYHMYPFQTGAGSFIFKENPDGSYDTSQMGIAPPTGSKFGAGISKLGQEKALSANLTLDIAKGAFLEGKSPYWITGPWSTADVQKSKVPFSVEAIPTWEGGEPTRPFVGVQGFVLSSRAKNAAAAQTFLNDFVMTTPFMDATYAAVKLPPAWKESYDKVASDPIIKGFGEYGANGDPMPANPEMAFVWADLGLAEYKIVGGADPDKTLTAAQAAIQKQIKEMASN
jgi:arabinogalactan oligomer/maltooligosaccharide transport system substrate-binding protein